ncbi:MAG: ankyrin repeat domain-containing protein [Brevinema sp.]
MKKRYLLLFLASALFADEFPSFNTAEFPSELPSDFQFEDVEDTARFFAQEEEEIEEIIIIEDLHAEIPKEVVYYGFNAPVPQHDSEGNVISITNIQTNSTTNITPNPLHTNHTDAIFVGKNNTPTQTGLTTPRSLSKPATDIRKQNKIDTQEFLKAAYSGDLHTLKQLMNRGISPNSRSVYDMKNGLTALISATGQRRHAVMQLLLENGADPNLASSYNKLHGLTPLMVAAMQGPIENVELLLQYEADPHAQTSGIVTGNSALSAAIGAGQVEIVELLLKKGVDINHSVNSRRYYGITPLMLAVDEGNIEIVEMLLEQKGININASDSEGKSALVYAYIRGKFEIIKLLIDAGANTHLSDEEIYRIVNKYRSNNTPRRARH